jgi:hypothetical protein
MPHAMGVRESHLETWVGCRQVNAATHCDQTIYDGSVLITCARLHLGLELLKSFVGVELSANVIE